MLRARCPGVAALVGLTGGIGSGKSSAMAVMRDLGAAAVVDADKVAHRAYLRGQPTFDQLVHAFGADIVGADGEVCRKTLGEKVFGRPDELRKLNGIVWPAIPDLVVREINDQVARLPAHSGPVVGIVEAALMIEAGLHAAMDETWCTVVPPEVAVARIMERNALTSEQAQRRIASQMTNDERARHCAVVIDTRGAKEETRRTIEREWAAFLERVKARL